MSSIKQHAYNFVILLPALRNSLDVETADMLFVAIRQNY
jgi:hypothetical protein